MSGEVFIAGHSLGAADAALYAFSRIKRGLRVDGVFLFACPRPGNALIGATLKAAGVPVISVRNVGDGVTAVPLDAHVGQFGWDYADVARFTDIHQPPSLRGFLEDPFFACHHIDLYQAGAHSLPPGDLAITLGEAVDQVARLYEDTLGWNWINIADGLVWSTIELGGARLAIRRGSKTGKDWLDEDFDFEQIDLHGAKVSRGFWSGVWPIESELDEALAA